MFVGSPTATTKIIWVPRNKRPKWYTRGWGEALWVYAECQPLRSLVLIFKAPKYKGQIILLSPVVSRERKQETWSLCLLGPVILMMMNALGNCNVQVSRKGGVTMSTAYIAGGALSVRETAIWSFLPGLPRARESLQYIIPSYFLTSPSHTGSF